MKKDTWNTILQVIASIITAAFTAFIMSITGLVRQIWRGIFRNVAIWRGCRKDFCASLMNSE